jgi:hypothetical protein
MAILLYTSSSASIEAAKRNAKRHREADGGQVDMRRETLRRHGAIDTVPGTDWRSLFWTKEPKNDVKTSKTKQADGKMVATKAKMVDTTGGANETDRRAITKSARSPIEGKLEEYKGKGKAMEKFQEEKPQAPES